MPGSFEKSVKGGTKIKLAAPKSKYVEHILVATHAGEAGVAEIFRALQNRLRDSTWTIVFKALIIVHLMIREGEPNVTLKFLAESPSKLAISNFSDVQVQGSNIRHYYAYLLGRAKAYRDTRIDWVREGQGRLKRQTIDKGLLRETETVQSQIAALVKCDLLSNEPENEITLTAFRLLTMDLLTLFHNMNEGTINVLEHYFEMSKYDAERALSIYKIFSKQTNQVVEYLSTARQYEHATRLDIPKLKHAPTSLTGSLEEYLNDPDFEINRRQYLAQQDARKGKKPTRNGATEPSDEFAKLAIGKNPASQSFPEPKASAVAPMAASIIHEPKAPAPDLIDFFESIEQNPQSMTGQVSKFQNTPQYSPQASQVQQPSGFAQNGQLQQQNTNSISNGNPFGQMQVQQPVQTNPIESGFSGYAQQPFGQSQIDSNGFSQQQQPFVPRPQFQQPQTVHTAQQFQPQQPFTAGQQPQSQQPFGPIQQPQQQSSFSAGLQSQPTNPFRKSMIPQSTGPSDTFANLSSMPSPQSHQSTNPFTRNVSTQPPSEFQGSPFTSELQGSPFQGSPFTSQPPNQGSPFMSQPPQSTAFNSPPPQQQQQQPQTTQPLQSMRTGTNPFARDVPPPHQRPSTASPLVPNATGSTNPFRQSQFVNQQTGQGWQTSQGSMGGLEQLPTIPVFPRPGQLSQPAQQGWL